MSRHASAFETSFRHRLLFEIASTRRIVDSNCLEHHATISFRFDHDGREEKFIVTISHSYCSTVQERHGTRLEYNIPKTYSLSKIFGFIETNQRRMNVIDYSLSQTTLEHVMSIDILITIALSMSSLGLSSFCQ
jgi:hypothetical protein